MILKYNKKRKFWKTMNKNLVRTVGSEVSTFVENPVLNYGIALLSFLVVKKNFFSNTTLDQPIFCA